MVARNDRSQHSAEPLVGPHRLARARRRVVAAAPRRAADVVLELCLGLADIVQQPSDTSEVAVSERRRIGRGTFSNEA